MICLFLCCFIRRYDFLLPLVGKESEREGAIVGSDIPDG